MYNQSFFNTVKGQNLLESIDNSLKRIADGIEKQSEFSKKSFDGINDFLNKIDSKKFFETYECEAVSEEDIIQTHYFDEDSKLKVRLIAAEICEEFEGFLDENGHIMIPDSQREGGEDEALLYGETYDEVENEVRVRLSKFFYRVIHEGLATDRVNDVAKDIFWNVFMPVYDNNGGQKSEDYSFYLSAGRRQKNIYDIINKIAYYLIDTAEEDYFVELNEEEY